MCSGGCSPWEAKLTAALGNQDPMASPWEGCCFPGPGEMEQPQEYLFLANKHQPVLPVPCRSWTLCLAAAFTPGEEGPDTPGTTWEAVESQPLEKYQKV
jgi:hypothetical protein